MRKWECSAAGITRKQQVNLLAKELFRKTIHVCTAFVPLLLDIAYWPVICILCAVIAVYIVSEVLRQRGILVPVISAVTAAAARKRDENHFVLGPLTLVFGVLTAALLFPPQAAAVGILALAFGDGLASFAGKLCGRIKIPGTAGKTAAGSLTCFAAIFISTFAVTGRAFNALIIGICGMIIELLPLKDFDNFFIPCILSGVSVLLSL